MIIFDVRCSYMYYITHSLKYYPQPFKIFSVQEIFEAIPQLKDNPLVQRVVEIFDEDQSGGLDFREFVMGKKKYVVKF